MDKTLATYINETLIGAGIPEDNEVLKKILSFTELNNKPAPDYLTIDSAKNNATLKSYFTASALDPVDKEIKRYATDMEIDATDFEAEKSSYKKLEMFVGKLKDKLKEAKKNPATSDEDKKQLADTIRGLNAQLSELKNSTVPKTEYDKLQKEAENERVDFLIDSTISSYKFGNGYDDEINKIALRKYINDTLNEKGAFYQLGEDKRSLKLKQAKSPDLEYYEENKPVAFKSFVDKIVAEKRMQSVRPQQQPQQPQHLRQNNPNPTINPVLQQRANSALEEFKKNSDPAAVGV